MENPIKMDDLGVPLFSETSIYVPMPLNIVQARPWLSRTVLVSAGRRRSFASPSWATAPGLKGGDMFLYAAYEL